MKADALPAEIMAPTPALWDDLVQASPGASVFHTAAWARLWTGLSASTKWEAAILEEGGRYVGALGWIVRRHGWFESLDAMPYATYGGPIVREGHPAAPRARRALIETFLARASRRRVLRAQLTWYAGRPEDFPEESPPDEGFTHVLALESDYERVADRFSPSTRRLVRQSDESGLSIRAAESAADVAQFVEIAEETVVRRGGKPKPRALYERIQADLVTAGIARYHLVEHEGKAVAGSLHLFHQGVATSWLPVSRESSWPLRPNNFLVASLLETLCQAGYTEYNFGASPSDAAGLIRFKEGWGARPRPVWTLTRRSAIHRRLRP
ncbi:MAG TPA: GNAT family N-acetyltransferase [Candidatus Eisenbacteria bacterium]|nr:GNAT family N-acetyltransferase [Candidatus Eisenbacteria bacterium]